MVSERFLKPKESVPTGNAPILGGDGRYLFYLDVQNQTLERVDLNGLGQTSLSLSGGYNYVTGMYIPDLDKNVIFGNNRYAICDPYTHTKDSDAAYPNSMPTTNVSCEYDWINKVMILVDGNNSQTSTYFFDLSFKVASKFSLAQKSTYSPKFVPPNYLYGNIYAGGGLNTNGLAIFIDDYKNNTSLVQSKNDGTAAIGSQAYYVKKLNSLFMTGASSMIVLNCISRLATGVVMSNLTSGAITFDEDNTIVTCRGNGATNHVLSRFNANEKTVIGHNTSKALTGSETGCKQLIYSPYTGKVYARPDAYGAATARILVYNPGADSFDADITVTSNTTVWNRRKTMWVNRLAI